MAEIHTPGSKRVVTTFVLVMFNISIMASLRNLPLVADYGYSALFYFFFIGLIFLIPSALVSAELATGWPKSGGIYIWVREAFGNKWGFFSVWMQWAHNLTWYPAILSFVAATIAYVFFPSMAENKVYILSVVLVGYWAMTFLNFLGIKTSSLFSTIGVIAGTILPGALIIALGISWLIMGNPSQITFQAADLVPDFSRPDNLVFLSGFFLAFAGLEVSAGYAGEVKNPQRNYPRAIIIAALVVFLLFMLGSLSIAFVVPRSDISLVTGLMEAFKVFLTSYHLEWILPVIGVLLVFGAIAEVNAWIIGPVKALATTSVHGNLPPYFQKTNEHGMPTRLLLFQAIIVTAVSFIFLFMPTVSTSYWILSAMAAQMYLIMYIMMFISAIKLRYSKPHIPRAYQIPHPHKGMWIVASIGVFASLFGLILSLLPPAQLNVGNIYLFESFIIFGLAIMIAIPFIIYSRKQPDWLILEKPDLPSPS